MKAPTEEPAPIQSDEQLMLRVRDGDRQAFSELVRRNARRFHRVAARVLVRAEDAEDVVQEAFLKIWARPGLWDPGRGARFTTWAHQMVVNLCRDANRRKRPVSLEDRVPLPSDNPGQDALLWRAEQAALLERLIRELPERQRIALTLCFSEGMSNREAADVMGVSVKSLQSLLMRAKQGLREKARPYRASGE